MALDLLSPFGDDSGPVQTSLVMALEMAMSLSPHLSQAVSGQCCFPACKHASMRRLVYSKSISVSASVFTLISVATRKDDTGHKESPQEEGMLQGNAQRWRAAAACF